MQICLTWIGQSLEWPGTLQNLVQDLTDTEKTQNIVNFVLGITIAIRPKPAGVSQRSHRQR